MKSFFRFSPLAIVLQQIVCVLVIFLASNTSINAQQNNNKTAMKHSQQDDFANTPYGDLLSRLEGLEPEYQANILFEIDKSGHKGIPDDKFTHALLHLFDAASQAHYESGLIFAANHPSESLIRYVSVNLPINKTDRLGMQTTIVGILRSNNPQLAASKFASIELPSKSANCTDAAVGDLHKYYDTLRDLYNDTRIKQIDDMQKSTYLVQVIHNANSLERITPLTKILPELQLQPETIQLVDAQFISQLNSINASDRELNALGLTFIQNINKLVNQGYPNSTKIVALLRQSLVANLQSGYCSDVSAPRDKIVEEFNKLIPQGSDMSPLHIAEVMPKTADGAANMDILQRHHEIDTYWNDLLEQTQQRSNEGNYPHGEPNPKSLSEDVDAVIHALHQPPSDYSCESCIFEGAAAKYLTMINSLPPGTQLEYATQEFITMLEQNPEEHDDAAIYSINIWWLMELSRPMSKEMRGRVLEFEKKGIYASVFNQSLEKDYIRTRISQSTDNVISTYAFYEDLYKPEFDVR